MRIVIKVGSSLLSSAQTTSGLDETFIGHLVQQIGTLHQQGHEIILVTSGAVATGMIKDKGYPPARAAMVGQNRLMNVYSRFFDQLSIRIGQALYTYYDLEDDHKFCTQERLLQGFKWGEVTIVNANDAVMDEELKALKDLADNDKLSAKIAVLIKADILVIMTDVDGLFCDYGLPEAELIKEVPLIDKGIIQLAKKTDSTISRGGMLSKIEAAKLATAKEVEVALINGKEPSILLKRINGPRDSYPGTTFLTRK
ncbi:glutamate 5-kinase [Patescibacteria group bacterium]|nr:glutamate 5-kinase [Patescibacteria group bacterium]MBU4512441.1 glutamate 5-kinase [Patescibacteria group bacterium]MCG2692569.1 glutamate 5-kinase [Candidatus Parcubacteria bacterium]